MFSPHSSFFFCSPSVKANRTAVIRELSRLGADLEARNDSGQVPAQLTKDRLASALARNKNGGIAAAGVEASGSGNIQASA